MLSCLLVDDEPLALELLTDYVKRIDFLHLAGVARNTQEAGAFLEQNQVDLLILDIRMPGQTGVEWARTLHRVPLLIFTTAYEDYAVEGFDLHAVDYLLKPIAFNRFETACVRAQQRLGSSTPAPEYLMIHSEYRLLRIPMKEILYVEGLKDYVKIYVENQPRAILTRMNLKAMEERLPEHQFTRLHRSFIVSNERITGLASGKVLLGKLEIPLGDAFRDRLPNSFKKN